MRRYSIYRNVAIGIIIVLMAVGCGGGGEPESIHVEVISDADAVAYQTGDGAWKDDLTGENLTDGKKRYTFDQTGDYGVALYCKGATDKGVTIFQLNTAESKSVVYECGKQNGSTISGTITDHTSVTPDGFAVAMGRNYAIVGSTGNYSMQVNHGVRDLIAVSLVQPVGGKITPQRFYLERGINFSGVDIGHLVTLTDANTYTMSGYSFTKTANTKAYAKLLSKNDTLFTANIDERWYVPTAGLVAEDTYLFYGVHIHHLTSYLEVYGADSIPKQNKNMDASYVQSLQGAAYTKAMGKFVGLDYVPSAQSQAMRYFVANVKNTATKEYYYAVLSSGWLKGKTDYTLPDFSSLVSFAGVWSAQSADKAGVLVLMSNKTVKEMFEAQRVYAPKDSPNFFFVIPGAKYETAYESVL